MYIHTIHSGQILGDHRQCWLVTCQFGRLPLENRKTTFPLKPLFFLKKKTSQDVGGYFPAQPDSFRRITLRSTFNFI